MASGDYKSCDVCGSKAFYDASLNYKHREESWDEINNLIIYEDRDFPPLLSNNRDTHLYLDYCGAWAILCNDCAKTHEAVIKLKEQEPK